MAIYDLTVVKPNKYKQGDILNIPYSGAMIDYSLKPGKYKFECWGAEGGYRSSNTYSGKGAYVVGEVTLSEEKPIFIYSGGSGNSVESAVSSIYPGGFNGGGYRYAYKGGGGASDIRIGEDSLYARILVAGGGASCGSSSYKGGNAGNDTGERGQFGCGSYGYGGTKNASTSTGGLAYIAVQGTTNSSSNCAAGFGFGGFGVYRSSGYGGAGGGGWYGGEGTYPDGSVDDDGGGGGGSSYVFTSDTKLDYPSGCLLTDDMFLENTNRIAGNTSMTSPEGTAETGHFGNGYVRITVLEFSSDEIYLKQNGEWIEVTNNFKIKHNDEWVEFNKDLITLNIKIPIYDLRE